MKNVTQQLQAYIQMIDEHRELTKEQSKFMFGVMGTSNTSPVCTGKQLWFIQDQTNKAWYGFIKANHIAEHSGFDTTIVDNLKQILELSCEMKMPIPKKEAQKIIERLLEFNETRLPELMKLISQHIKIKLKEYAEHDKKSNQK
tara:strand:- start:501 stop:932 length:432 start_codon:yes stop_codon:yes gene_type:complete